MIRVIFVRFVYRPISAPAFHHLHGHKTAPGEGIYGNPHLVEVSPFSQIREALRSCLSTSADSHLPPVQNTPKAKVTYSGEA